MGTAARACAIIVGAVIASGIWAPGASAESATWGNTTPITFSGHNATGPGLAYPSTIHVTGHEGPITDVDLRVNHIAMADFGHLHMLLVAPSGEAEIAKRGHCHFSGGTDLNLIFDQDVVTTLPYNGPCAGGRYKPTSSNCGQTCDATWPEVPGGPHSVNFDNFNNENANGTWKLYAYRHCYNDCPASGDEIGSWSISIETGPIDLDLPAASTTAGPASPYPSVQNISGVSGLITDLDVDLNGIYHSYPDDIEIMVEKVGGPRVMLMSDACGSGRVQAFGWTWSDEAGSVMADEGSANACASSRYRPTDHSPGESLPSPAPPGPYSTSLSDFDFTDPNGQYRLWVADDATGDEGFVTHHFTLQYRTREPAQTSFATTAVEVVEGGTQALTVRRSGEDAYGTATVEVNSAPVTASDADFTAISSMLQFAAGETEKTIDVDALADGESEGAEAFTVALSTPTGDAGFPDPSTATAVVTIPANANDPGLPAPTPGDDATPVVPSPDTAPPETIISKSPKRATTRRKAKIAFASSEPGSRFECKLDRNPFGTCSSPAKLKKLDSGRHRFLVRGIDAAGNIDPSPAAVKWKVR